MSTRRALGFSFLDRYAALVLSIGSSMVIARLLTPAEIGVFSVTMVFLFALNALRDMGAGQYLIQERELAPTRLRAAWTVSLGTGLTAAVLVAALAVPVSRFYGDARMAPIMGLIAVNFAINPFGSLTYAWLMREMRFEALASMRFLSGLVGAAVSVGLAWADHGPISLAWGNLATTLTNALVAAWHRPVGFPLLPGFVQLRPVVAKGSRFSGSGLIVGLSSAAPELVLGKLQSLEAAALFSRGNGLAAMFQKLVLDATQVVAVPMFAKEARARGDVSQSFLRSVSYVTVLGWSFFSGLALLAHPAVLLLYGDQWGGAVAATRWISVSFMLALPAAMCSSVLLGLGEAALILRATLAVTSVQVAATLAGAWWKGLEGVAMASLVTSGATLVIWLGATRRIVGFSWGQLAATLGPSALAAAITSAAPLACAAWLGLRPASAATALLATAASGGALFLLALRITRHPLGHELVRLLPARFKP